MPYSMRNYLPTEVLDVIKKFFYVMKGPYKAILRNSVISLKLTVRLQLHAEIGYLQFKKKSKSLK